MNHLAKSIVQKEPSNALKEVKIKNDLRSDDRTMLSRPTEMLNSNADNLYQFAY